MPAVDAGFVRESTAVNMADPLLLGDHLGAKARRANLARKDVYLGEASGHVCSARAMHTVEVGHIDDVVVHQPEKTNAQPRQKHCYSTSRTAAAHDTDPQPSDDWIEPPAEQYSLPRQELIFVSRVICASDLDLTAY